MIVIGLMSGTSADGIDAAVVNINGVPPELHWNILAHTHYPYPDELRAEIFALFQPGEGSTDRLCRLNFALGSEFGKAALKAIQAAGLTPAQVDLIGSHGQTLWHEPSGIQPSTLQVGEPAVIAELSGLPVISSFRTGDMAAGGQGAPLVALVDAILLSHPQKVRVAQNIGGIANLTYLPPQQDDPEMKQVFAFDTGPGNMLMDWTAWRMSAGTLTYDRDGTLAARGTIHTGMLTELLDEPYFRLHPPKSTGRERFGAQAAEQIWNHSRNIGLKPEDLLSTLVEFTVESIRRAYNDYLPRFPEEVIVSGGGARNRHLMERLSTALAPSSVMISDEVGLKVEAKEAVAFAILAYESWHQRPGNLPAATGAHHPVVLGSLTPGKLMTPKTIFLNQERARTNKGIPSSSSHITESPNPATTKIDTVSTLKMVEMINQEDARVALAVQSELPQIAQAIDAIAARMDEGGRLVYIGAGTSGRLGVLDAAECPPTFSTPPELIVALIAGGERAITHAVEGAEDDAQAGAQAVAGINIGPQDSLIGIAASGTTRYVLGGLEEARRRGALTISLACNRPTPMEDLAEISIAPLVGPEVIAGSTRLKSGSAQKMVLNMISTGVMIRLGKTYKNLMVDVHPTNAKLRQRARRIVALACDQNEENAASILEACDGEVKTAIVACQAKISPAEARQRLEEARGIIRLALKMRGD